MSNFQTLEFCWKLHACEIGKAGSRRPQLTTLSPIRKVGTVEMGKILPVTHSSKTIINARKFQISQKRTIDDITFLGSTSSFPQINLLSLMRSIHVSVLFPLLITWNTLKKRGFGEASYMIDSSLLIKLDNLWFINEV